MKRRITILIALVLFGVRAASSQPCVPNVPTDCTPNSAYCLSVCAFEFYGINLIGVDNGPNAIPSLTWQAGCSFTNTNCDNACTPLDPPTNFTLGGDPFYPNAYYGTNDCFEVHYYWLHDNVWQIEVFPLCEGCFCLTNTSASPASSITLIDPNGGETWHVGNSYAVQWLAVGAIDSIRVELNRDFPSGVWEELAGNEPDDGSYTWNANGPEAIHARVRVSDRDNATIADTSAADFVIDSPPATVGIYFGLDVQMSEDCIPGAPWLPDGRVIRVFWDENANGVDAEDQPWPLSNCNWNQDLVNGDLCVGMTGSYYSGCIADWQVLHTPGSPANRYYLKVFYANGADPQYVSVVKTLTMGYQDHDFLASDWTCLEPPPHTADIVFVIDVSRSMEENIRDIASGISSLVSELAIAVPGIDVRFGLITYGQDADPSAAQACPSTTGLYYGGPRNRTIDGLQTHEQMITTLNNIACPGQEPPDCLRGGNEPGYHAVQCANGSTPWRGGSLKRIVLVSDENNDWAMGANGTCNNDAIPFVSQQSLVDELIANETILCAWCNPIVVCDGHDNGDGISPENLPCGILDDEGCNSGLTDYQPLADSTGGSAVSLYDTVGVLLSALLNTITDPPQAVITILSPNSWAVWGIGEQKSILWTSEFLSGEIRIQLSRSTFANWETLVENTANTGSYNWTVTGPVSSTCRVRILSAADSTIADTSNSNFAITPGATVSITIGTTAEWNMDQPLTTDCTPGGSGLPDGRIVRVFWDENANGPDAPDQPWPLNNCYWNEDAMNGEWCFGVPGFFSSSCFSEWSVLEVPPVPSNQYYVKVYFENGIDAQYVSDVRTIVVESQATQEHFFPLSDWTCMTPPSPTGTWSPQNSTTGNHLRGVDFEDANNGWVSGIQGTILHTMNGGLNWTQQSSGVNDHLHDIMFVNLSEGWSVGTAGVIRHTTDGGTNWSGQPSAPGDLLAVHFVSSLTGWVSGAVGLILKTTDGGSNWVSENSNTTIDLTDLFFVDAQNGWAVGEGGAVIRTTSGGTTWTPQTSNTSVNLHAVNFNDLNDGWAAGNARTIIRTTDGGSTWQSGQFGPSQGFYGMGFADSQNGWAGGDFGYIIRTSDGGATWAQEYSQAQDLYEFAFANATTGWVVGDNGTILHYAVNEGLSGSLSGSIGPGEFHVVGDISVEPDSQLVIQPGTTLMFDGPFTLRIGGEFLALGIESDSIVFTSSPVDSLRWHGVRVESTDDTSRFRYCRIENAKSVTDSEPDDHGGGIFAYYASPVIEHCLITNCTAKHGGGIYLSHSSNGRVTDCVIANNSADPLSGGGMFIQQLSNPLIERCDIRGNTAINDGGAVYVYLAAPRFVACSISGNSATSRGGGIYLETADSLLMDSCRIEGNTALAGGGAFCLSSDPDVVACTFIDNTAGELGGGAMEYDASGGQVERCFIQGNRAVGNAGGGGLHFRNGSTTTVVNCEISLNTAGTAAGGIGCWESSPVIDFCSLIANSAPHEGAGIGVYNGSQMTLTNNILAKSAPADALYSNGNNLAIAANNVFFVNSTDASGILPVDFLVMSEVNPNGDPCDPYQNMHIFSGGLFVAPATNDFHLLDHSMCIGAADTTGAPITDIEGNPRPYPPGSRPDIGAYENLWVPPTSVDTLFLFLRLDGDSVDASYYGNDAALFGGAFAPDRFDLTAQAFALNGTSDYLTAGVQPVSNVPLTAFSFALWIKPEAMESIGQVFEALTSGGPQYGGIYVEGTPDSGFYFSIHGDTDAVQYRVSAPPVSAGQWYHLAGTYDGTTQKIYLDGAVVDSLDWTGTLTFTSGLSFGKDFEGDFQYFHGSLDEIRVYSRILGEAEISGFAADRLRQLAGPLSGTIGPGEYRVVEDISVDSGNTLTIIPPAMVIFDGYYRFEIDGCLKAIGNEQDSIVFTTTDTVAGWGGLEFVNAADSSKLEYCVVEYAWGEGTYPDQSSSANIYCFECSPTISRCTIRNSIAAYAGGGICCVGASPLISCCLIAGNRAEYGAGVYCYNNAAPLVEASEISFCAASVFGGGVNNDADAAPVYRNCLIRNNSAPEGGGVLLHELGGGTFEHCTITGNSAGSGAGVRSKADASHSYIFRNSIVSFCNGPAFTFNTAFSGQQIRHCDIYGNTGQNFEGGAADLGSLDTINANGTPCDPYFNVFVDPLFADAAGGDFRLRDGSLCIGAADTTNAPVTDFDGNPRPNPLGSRPDIGAYESGRGTPLESMSSLVGYWPMDGNVIDLSGNGHDGMVFNAIPTVDRSGLQDAAFHFNGADARIELGNWFNYGEFTFSAWVKPSAIQVDFADIVDNNHTAFRSWVVQQSANAQNQMFFGVATATAGMDDGLVHFTLTPNVWRHIACVKDTVTVRVYINGSLVGSVPDTGRALYDGSQQLGLGRFWQNGSALRFWSGDMDEVRLYGKALSDAEILTLATNDCPPTAVPMVDDFESVMDGCWSWLNEAPSHWSMTDRPGWLRITTQPGYIRDGNGVNYLLRSAPDSNSYIIQTKLAFDPNSNYHNAGLILVHDQHNVVEINRGFSSGQVLALNGYVNDIGLVGSHEIPCSDTLVTLRLAVHDSIVQATWSADGVTYSSLGSLSAPWLMDSVKVGCWAIGLVETAPEIPADFDNFQISNYQFDHNTTNFPLTGQHAAISCLQCHLGGEFAGTPTACLACHDDDYQATANPDHEVLMFPQECALCHTTTAWQPSSFDHNLTAFPLTGQHVSVSCVQCHTNGQYTGTPSDCWSCHETAYLNSVNPDHEVSGFSHSCTECHSTSGWSPALLPPITVTAPNGGETWNVGDQHSIAWDAPWPMAMQIRLDRNYPSGNTEVIADIMSGSTSYDWMVTGPATVHARIILYGIDSLAHEFADTSDADFAILTGGNRVVLFDHFTNANSGPDAAAHPTMWPMLNGLGPDTVAVIAYHAWWPLSGDSMYNWNPVESAARIRFYNVFGVPHAIVDGTQGFTPTSSNAAQMAAAIRARFAVSPPCEISLSASIAGSTSIGFSGTITANQDMSGSSTRVFAALVTDSLQYPTAPGSNGETTFLYVFRDLWPDTTGQALQLLNGQQFNFNGTLNRDSTWSHYDLRVIVFVQNMSTREIYQSAITAVTSSGTQFLHVDSPNGGEDWTVGDAHQITWSTSVPAQQTYVTLVRDFPSGSSEEIGFVSGSGTAVNWTVTGPGSDHARVIVRAEISAIEFLVDTSDADFTILEPTIQVTHPNGGDTLWIGVADTITWTSTLLSPTDTVFIAVSRDYPTSPWEIINNWSTGSPNSGQYVWVPSGPPTANARVRISDMHHSGVSDESDASFEIVELNPPVVINEIVYDTPGTDNPDIMFTELWGPPGTDLSGWSLVGINGNGGALYRSVSLTGTIPVDGYYVVGGSTVSNLDQYEVIDWQNAGTNESEQCDAIQLRSPSNQVVDAVCYGNCASGQVCSGEGQSAIDYSPTSIGPTKSLARIPDHVDTEDNATDFQVTAQLTPGSSNSLGYDFYILAPNGGETWVIGDTAVITWSAPLISENVTVELNRSFPDTTWEIIATNIPNSGLHSWPVSGPPTMTARVRVTAVTTTTLGDTSNANFAIGDRSIALTTPNGGETWYVAQSVTIGWTSEYLLENVRIELDRNFPSGPWEVLAASVPNSGNYSWTVTGPVTATTRVRVSGATHSTLSDTSDENFTIAQPSLALLSPNGGESKWITNSDTIRWTASNLAGNVNIELDRDYPSGSWVSVVSNTSNDGLQTWTVSGPVTSAARIRVVSVVVPTVGDTSDQNFTIDAATLTLVHPNGGDSLFITNPDTIHWSSAHLSGNVMIDLNRTYPSANWETIVANTVNDGSHVWSVTAPVSGTTRLRARSVLATEIGDTSDTELMIAAPTVIVQIPNGGEQWYVTKPDTIRWSTSRLVGNVSIQLNREYPGGSWVTLATNTANDGKEAWTASLPTTTAARMRVVSAVSASVGDSSDGDFEIALPTIVLVDPNGGDTLTMGQQKLITWASQFGAGTVRIEVCRDYPSASWDTISSATDNDGSYAWLVTYPESERARIRITHTSLASVGDTCDGDFVIPPPSPAQLPGLVGNPFPTEADIISSATPLVSWSPAAQALTYDLYFWPDSTPIPTTPVSANQTNTYYQIATALQSGHSYRWTVVARNVFGETPGSQWTFRLRSLADLRVDTVLVNQAYSGQPLQVTWRVTNYGQGPTSVPEWFDRIWLTGDLTADIDEPEDLMLGQHGNVSALDSGESYTNTQTIPLPGITIGQHYVWVITDNRDAHIVDLESWCAQSHSYGPVVEDNECDNFDFAEVYINESPTPDLVVTALASAPATTFSGDTVHVDWSVRNSGSVPTQVSSWSDAIYLSPDTVLDGADVLVDVIAHTGVLQVGGEYSAARTFTLPVSVTGTRFVIVKTDVYDGVYESGQEWNNAELSDIVNITLTPPPDLVVDSISSPEVVSNRETIAIEWRVHNQGSGPTHETSWNDRVYLSTDSTLELATDYVLGTFAHSGVLEAGETYLRAGNVTIPNGWSGTTYVFVATDFNSQVFENGVDGNNAFRRPTPIEIISPDLAISTVSGPDTAAVRQQIPVHWSVTNFGPGPLLSGTWNDRVYLSADTIFSPGSDVVLGTFAKSGDLLPFESYEASGNVTIPDGIAGAFHLFVKCDGNDAISEAFSEVNNVARCSSPLQVFTPDLTVTEMVVPTGANSGDSVSVQWSVLNQGVGQLVAMSWTDRVYLSLESSYNPATATVLGNVPQTRALQRDSSYSRQASFLLPNGISGPYYIYVKTDGADQIFENALDANNLRRSDGTVTVNLSPWPDLVVAALPVPLEVTAGGNLPLSVIIIDSGNASAPPVLWTDKLFLSANSSWSPGTNLEFAAVPHNGPLGIGESYGITHSVSLSSGISGTYYVYVQTDANNSVFEHIDDANNIVRSAGITVHPYPAVDLAVTTVTIPDTVHSAQPFVVQWRGENVGLARTLASSWTDAAYLSVDTVLSYGEDAFLASATHYGALEPGQAYNETRSVTLADGTEGAFYVIVRTDIAGAVSDANPQNNIQPAPAPLIATLTPWADLTVSQFSADTSATAGQPLSLSWTIQNSGTGSTLVSPWFDAVYLSLNTVIEASDVRLVTHARNTALALDSSYLTLLSADVPSYLSGNYYLLLSTDNSNAIYEHGFENNNLAMRPIWIRLLPPADLIVSDISVPDSASPGDSVTVTWTVQNIGENPATGLMRDGVYFSADTTWDLADPLLALNNRSVNILPGGGMSLSAVVQLSETMRDDSGRTLDEERSGEAGNANQRMPGVSPGQYFAIVRTDLRDNIRESNNGNNNGASPATLNVTVPELPYGEQVNLTLAAGEQRFFSITALAGLDLQFNLECNLAGAMNELYASFSAVPTLREADFVADEPFSPNQELLLPAVQNGIWYVMIVARTLPEGFSTELLTLTASQLQFSALSVSPNQGGAGGSVTCLLRGAGFDSTLQIGLELPDSILPGQIVRLANRTQALVNWDLQDVVEGTYNLIGSRGDGFVSVLDGGFSVVPLQRSVDATIQGPSVMRTERDYRFELLATNTGNVDLTNVRLFTSVPPGVGYRLSDMAEFTFPDTEAVMEAVILQLPAGSTQSVSLWVMPRQAIGTSALDISALEPGARLGFETEYAGHLISVVTDSTGQPEPPTSCSEYTEPVLWTLTDACPGYLDYFRTSTEDGAALGDAWGLRTDGGKIAFFWGQMGSDNEGRATTGTGRIEEFLWSDLTGTSVTLWDGQIVHFEHCFSVQPAPSGVMPGLAETVAENLALRGNSESCYCEHPSFDEFTGLCTVCGSQCLSSLDNAIWLSYNSSTLVPPVGELEQVLQNWLLENSHPAIGTVDVLGDFEAGSTDEELWESLRRRQRNGRTVPIRLLASQDPNTINGPLGFGDMHWVSRDETYTYTINFENLNSESAAPAQRVHIAQSLDPALNLNSFRIGNFRFANVTVDAPANRAYLSRRLDVRDSLGVFVDVTAGIDVFRRELFWIFESIDPATGQQPLNPLIGLLPVNDSLHHRGEGFVSYTVNALTNAPTQDTIYAAAQITFDVNEPITTPAYFNRLDAVAPVSHLDSLPQYLDSTLFEVHWSAQDDSGGSGIANCDLYVTVNDGPFTLYQDRITDTTLVFGGLLFNNYGFATRARDQTGNLEPMKSTAEASVYLALPPPSQSISDLSIQTGTAGGSRHVTLRWSAVREDTLGNPITVDEYRIYTQSGTFGSDVWTLLASPSDTTFTYSLAADSGETRRFFRVIAFRTGEGILLIPTTPGRVRPPESGVFSIPTLPNRSKALDWPAGSGIPDPKPKIQKHPRSSTSHR